LTRAPTDLDVRWLWVSIRDGAAAANRRIAASSVGSLWPDIDPPCVL